MFPVMTLLPADDTWAGAVLMLLPLFVNVESESRTIAGAVTKIPVLELCDAMQFTMFNSAPVPCAKKP